MSISSLRLGQHDWGFRRSRTPIRDDSEHHRSVATLAPRLCKKCSPSSRETGPERSVGTESHGGFTLDAKGCAAALLIPLGVAFLFRRDKAWMNVAAAVWVGGLSWISASDLSDHPLSYLWCGLGAAEMIVWGLYESRTERVNLGMAGFALTIAFFFFSNVMDKLGRSASLIALGVMFLAALQCLLVLSLTGKLLYDRASRPRVWVKTRPWDPPSSSFSPRRHRRSSSLTGRDYRGQVKAMRAFRLRWEISRDLSDSHSATD